MDQPPRRKPMRLQGWDYRTPGGYFVTICTHRRMCLFGEVINDAMRLNAYGEIAAMCWEEIPEHFKMAGIDEFVIMPHHVHGMVFLEADLESDAGAQHALSLQDPPDEEKAQFGRILPKSLSSIIRSCKSAVTCNINQHRGTPAHAYGSAATTTTSCATTPISTPPAAASATISAHGR